MNLDGARLVPAIAHVNRLRAGGRLDGDAERLVNTLFDADRKLVVYGTLKPGEKNARVLSELDGEWRDAFVHGTLHQEGWGAVHGFPAIRLDPGAPAVPAKLLVSAALPDHWARLDRFEGEEYQRVLTLVHDDRAIVAVANIYQAREIPAE